MSVAAFPVDLFVSLVGCFWFVSGVIMKPRAWLVGTLRLIARVVQRAVMETVVLILAGSGLSVLIPPLGNAFPHHPAFTPGSGPISERSVDPYAELVSNDETPTHKGPLVPSLPAPTRDVDASGAPIKVRRLFLLLLYTCG